MPQFSKESLAKLATCDERLQRLFLAVVEDDDCIVIEGHREMSRQIQLKKDGFTKTLKSKHLPTPALAVDVAPYPLDWKDLERFRMFAARVIRKAAELEIKIRWGGEFKKFFDGPHFELVE